MRKRARAMSACVCVCARVSVCVHLQACARARVCVRVCVPLSANVRVRAIPSDCTSARVCSERVCAPRRCARPPIARRRLAVFIARPAPRVGGRARGCVRCDGPVVARVWPQVSPGRAARPARRGPRDIGTRPWSTPPAPSTSSAATTATTTCGRAPTEVRGPDSVEGGGRVGFVGWALEWGNRGGTKG